MLLFDSFNQFSLGLALRADMESPLSFVHSLLDIVIFTRLTRLKDRPVPSCFVTVGVTVAPEKDFPFPASFFHQFAFAVVTRARYAGADRFAVPAVRIFLTADVSPETPALDLKLAAAIRTRFLNCLWLSITVE